MGPGELCLFIALIVGAPKTQLHEHPCSGVGPKVGHQWNCVAVSDGEPKEAAVILSQAELTEELQDCHWFEECPGLEKAYSNVMGVFFTVIYIHVCRVEMISL